MGVLYTSLAEIASFDPPNSTGWKKILLARGTDAPKNIMFPLKEALKSNSFADVCWLLGKRQKEIRICIQAAKACADSVSHMRSYDYKVIDAIDAINAAADAVDTAEVAAADAATAADVAEAAAYAAYAAAAYAAAAAANVATYATYLATQTANKQFLLQAIEEFEAAN